MTRSSSPPSLTSQFSQYSSAMLANSDLEPRSQSSAFQVPSTTVPQWRSLPLARTNINPSPTNNQVFFKVLIESAHHIQLSTTASWNYVRNQFRWIISLYGTDDPGPDALHFLQSPADTWPKLIGNSSIYTKWVSRITSGTTVQLTVVSLHLSFLGITISLHASSTWKFWFLYKRDLQDDPYDDTITLNPNHISQTSSSGTSSITLSACFEESLTPRQPADLASPAPPLNVPTSPTHHTKLGIPQLPSLPLPVTLTPQSTTPDQPIVMEHTDSNSPPPCPNIDNIPNRQPDPLTEIVSQ